MSSLDHYTALSEFSEWAPRQINEALSELRLRLLAEAPVDAQGAVQELMDQLDGMASDEWPCHMRQVLRDAEPAEDDTEAYENPRREHGTYDATSIYGGHA